MIRSWMFFAEQITLLEARYTVGGQALLKDLLFPSHFCSKDYSSGSITALISIEMKHHEWSGKNKK